MTAARARVIVERQRRTKQGDGHRGTGGMRPPPAGISSSHGPTPQGTAQVRSIAAQRQVTECALHLDGDREERGCRRTLAQPLFSITVSTSTASSRSAAGEWCDWRGGGILGCDGSGSASQLPSVAVEKLQRNDVAAGTQSQCTNAKCSQSGISTHARMPCRPGGRMQSALCAPWLQLCCAA